tara:strand:+ start:679 stop:1728 length:1050 start_codon:yes stop_codon:yes gene_type:complete
MIKAVIFDVGGVLQGHEWSFVVNSLLDLRPDLSVKEYLNAFYHDRENYFDLYQVSRISSEEFWGMVADRLNISKIHINRLKESFEHLYSFVNLELIEILKNLKNNYKLFILSNSCPELENRLVKNDYYSLFDKAYFSHNICCRKPNKDSYQKVLEDNDLRPQECILVEDNIGNIESAKEMGINTLFVKNNGSLKEELSGLLDGKEANKGELIGYTTGVFDLFHIGHLNLLRNAKKHCDRLIVGLTTDELSLSFKNKTPVVPLAERMEIVKAIEYVDEVVVQENMDKFDAWKRHRFHVMFASGTPTAKWPRVEAEFMANFARDNLTPPEIIRLDYTPEVSSTSRREEVGK